MTENKKTKLTDIELAAMIIYSFYQVPFRVRIEVKDMIEFIHGDNCEAEETRIQGILDTWLKLGLITCQMHYNELSILERVTWHWTIEKRQVGGDLSHSLIR